jgi:phosphoglycerate dehydrogenase-like enzyme
MQSQNTRRSSKVSISILVAVCLLLPLKIITVSSFSLSATALLPRRHILLAMTSAVTTSTTNSDNNNGQNYWNRETSKLDQSQSKIESKPIINQAKIICISDPKDVNNVLLYKEDGSALPKGSKVLAIGSSMDDFDVEALKKEKANVIFVSSGQSREPLAKLIEEIPSIEWIHSRSAGIDYMTSPTLSKATSITMTNAKGSFSSTLAEYTMMAISYFAKDLPRLLKQKKETNWEKYSVEEIRGKSLGIIGYGDIGRASAKLAKAYGMNIIVQRRNPSLSQNDILVDEVYGNGQESINKIMKSCDYILVSAPLTNETRGMINKEAFANANPNAVIINVGRGPIIDEDAMIQVLKEGKLKGAALDVTTIEPLPVSSELWGLDNVLLSPHNMDQTDTFQMEATDFFLKVNLPRFACGETLMNPVDKAAGY